MGCAGSSSLNPPLSSVINPIVCSSYISKRSSSTLKKIAVVLDCDNEEDFEVVYLSESYINRSKIPKSKYFTNRNIAKGMKVKVYFTIGSNQVEKVEPMKVTPYYAKVIQLSKDVVRLELTNSKRIIDIQRSNIAISDLGVNNYVEIISEEDEILEIKLTTQQLAENHTPVVSPRNNQIRKPFNFQRKSHEPYLEETKNETIGIEDKSTNPVCYVAQSELTEDNISLNSCLRDDYIARDMHNRSLQETSAFGSAEMLDEVIIYESIVINSFNEASQETIGKKCQNDVEFSFMNEKMTSRDIALDYGKHSFTISSVFQAVESAEYEENLQNQCSISHTDICIHPEDLKDTKTKLDELEIIEQSRQVSLNLFKAVTSEEEPDSHSVYSELSDEHYLVHHQLDTLQASELEVLSPALIDQEIEHTSQLDQRIQELPLYTDQDLEILAEENLLTISKYRLPLRALKLAFKFKEGFSEQVDILTSKYESWTRSRGDGNCYYRCVGVSYLEYLFRRSTPLQKAQKFLNSLLSQQGIYSLYNEDPNSKDYRNMITTNIQHMITIKANVLDNLDCLDYSQVLIRLHDLLQNEEFDLAIIKELRNLAANYLLATEDLHPFLDVSLDNQLQHMRTIGTEASGIEFTCMSHALQVNINHVEVYNYNNKKLYSVQGSIVELSLLFKPGHYDILNTYQQNIIDQYSVKKLAFMNSE